METRWWLRQPDGLIRTRWDNDQLCELSYLSVDGRWINDPLRSWSDPNSGYQEAIHIDADQAQQLAPQVVLDEDAWQPPWAL